MNKLAALVSLLTCLLAIGCTASPSEPSGADGTPPQGDVQQSAAPTRLQWGQAGTVAGTNGQQIKVTPIGILYDQGSESGGAPENGVFVVLALKAEAVEQADSIAAPMTGGGFMWQGEDAQRIDSVAGNATSTAWVGSVHEFSNIPIQPGEPEVGIETFDIPTQGGRLVYVDPTTMAVTSWDLPTADQGGGLDKVRQRIAKFT